MSAHGRSVAFLVTTGTLAAVVTLPLWLAAVR